MTNGTGNSSKKANIRRKFSRVTPYKNDILVFHLSFIIPIFVIPTLSVAEEKESAFDLQLPNYQLTQ